MKKTFIWNSIICSIILISIQCNNSTKKADSAPLNELGELFNNSLVSDFDTYNQVYFVGPQKNDCVNCYVGLKKVHDHLNEHPEKLQQFVYLFEEENENRNNYFIRKILKIELIKKANRILNAKLFNEVEKQCNCGASSFFGVYNTETGKVVCNNLRKIKSDKDVQLIFDQ